MEMNNHVKGKTKISREDEEESDHTAHDAADTKTLIKTFGSYTTLHGFHFLSDSNSAIRRIVWLVLMIICLAIMTVNLKENYAKLRRHDSSVTKDIEYARTLLFPAVSICNQNMLLKSKINGTAAQAYLDGIDYLKAEYMGNASNKQVPLQLGAPFNIDQAVREAGHNLSTMMKLCLWRGEKCGVENFTTFISFYRGLCYTFNSGAPGHPLLNVTSSGISQALNLIIDVQPEEYYGPFSYEGTGLRVLLHEQKEWPEMENLGVDITPGYNTNIRIQRSKVISLEPPFKPPCGTRKLVTTKTYSTSTCFHECFQKQLMNVCKCRFLGMPVGGEFNLSNFCSTEETRNCIMPTIDKLNVSECDCPVQCEKIKYGSQLSSAYFPSLHFWDTVYQLLNESENGTKSDVFQGAIRRRLLKLNIFYESLSTEVTKERPTYDIHDFGSDMGGSMGLFLGCSLLTLCEFLDLLIMAIVRCYTADKHASKKINHERVATRDTA